MKDNNTNEEVTVEGLEIVTEKAVELNKKDFFKMLAAAEDGLTLTIDRVGKVFRSKYANNNGLYPFGCFVDYTFKKDSKNYGIGIYYNLGVPLDVAINVEDLYKFKLTSNMNLFKILAITVDLSEAEEIVVTNEFIEDSLTGITFKAEIGTSYNGTFLIEPTELIS